MAPRRTMMSCTHTSKQGFCCSLFARLLPCFQSSHPPSHPAATRPFNPHTEASVQCCVGQKNEEERKNGGLANRGKKGGKRSRGESWQDGGRKGGGEVNLGAWEEMSNNSEVTELREWEAKEGGKRKTAFTRWILQARMLNGEKVWKGESCLATRSRENTKSNTRWKNKHLCEAALS